MDSMTTEKLLRRHRKYRQEATMSGNVGAFAVPIGGMLRRVPAPPYEEVPTKPRKKTRRRKR